MNRSKIVAVITGAIAVLLSIIYLLIVQILDFRGEMLPAPQDLSYQEFVQEPARLVSEWVSVELVSASTMSALETPASEMLASEIISPRADLSLGDRTLV